VRLCHLQQQITDCSHVVSYWLEEETEEEEEEETEEEEEEEEIEGT
jgi:hypothetical protein